MDAGRSVLVMVSTRLDMYNNEGRLRRYYPAGVREAEFLGEKADDPAELSAFVEKSIRSMFAKAFEDDDFVKALDLDPDTVRELMKAKPAPGEVPPGEKATEPVPGAPEPKKGMSEEEQRRELEKDLENAVKEGTTPKAP
jgi:hypothetical protein